MFVVQPHDATFKSFVVRDSNSEIEFTFDYDDVNHQQVDAQANLVATILNENHGFIMEKMYHIEQL